MIPEQIQLCSHKFPVEPLRLIGLAERGQLGNVVSK